MASRVRRAALLLGVLGAALGIVEAKAATAPPVRVVALGVTPGAGGAGSAVRHPAVAGSSPAGSAAGPHPTSAVTAAGTTGVRSVLGAPVDIGYGIVQVRLVLHGSRVTNVVTVQLPTYGRSADIAAFAVPVLRSEVLARQSALIDTVSGASYTSEGYARSVQAALDRAGLR